MTAGGYAAAPPQDEYATISFVPEACLRILDSNAPRRGCGATPFIALQSTLDRSAGSPGAPASTPSTASMFQLSSVERG